MCSDVAIEPALIPITGETFDLKSTIKGPGARSDVSARGFWTPMQRACFDIYIYIKVTHLNTFKRINFLITSLKSLLVLDVKFLLLANKQRYNMISII